MRLRKGGRECRDDYCCGLHGSMVDRVGRYDIGYGYGYGVFLDELAFGLLLLVVVCSMLRFVADPKIDTWRHFPPLFCALLYG